MHLYTILCDVAAMTIFVNGEERALDIWDFTSERYSSFFRCMGEWGGIFLRITYRAFYIGDLP